MKTQLKGRQQLYNIGFVFYFPMTMVKQQSSAISGWRHRSVTCLCIRRLGELCDVCDVGDDVGLDLQVVGDDGGLDDHSRAARRLQDGNKMTDKQVIRRVEASEPASYERGYIVNIVQLRAVSEELS